MAREIRELPIIPGYGDYTNIIADMHRITSNTDQDGAWELRIRDSLSGEFIVGMRMDAAQFSNLISGSQAYPFAVEVGTKPGRLGQRRVRYSQNIPPGVTDVVRPVEEQQKLAMAWAEQYAREHAAIDKDFLMIADISVHKSKGGWSADFDRWEDA